MWPEASKRPNLTGRFVATLRKQHDPKISQQKLANELGVSIDSIRSWESGRQPMYTAVVQNFLAIADALGCSTQDRNNLVGATRADQWLQRILDAGDESALIKESLGVTLTGRVRNWLNTALTSNRLSIHPNNPGPALDSSVLECIQQRMILAAESAFGKPQNFNQLNVFFLLLGRCVRLSGDVQRRKARELLTEAYGHLAPENVVARRDLAICLGELGDIKVLRSYLGETESNEEDCNQNLDWLARLVEEDEPGPRVLHALIEILERGMLDHYVAPLLELNLRTPVQLMDRSGEVLCRSVSLNTLRHLLWVVREIQKANSNSEEINRRTTVLCGRIGKMLSFLIDGFESLREISSAEGPMPSIPGGDEPSKQQFGF